jgi:hypothetical protein
MRTLQAIKQKARNAVEAGLHMSTPAPEKVFSDFLDAFEARDFERVRSCLSDVQFSHRGPAVSSFTNADAFVAYIERIGPILECIERRKLFVDGNTVCAILNLKTTMEGMRLVPLVELATIVDGKITGLEVFFDATAYNRMFEPD